MIQHRRITMFVAVIHQVTMSFQALEACHSRMCLPPWTWSGSCSTPRNVSNHLTFSLRQTWFTWKPGISTPPFVKSEVLMSSNSFEPLGTAWRKGLFLPSPVHLLGSFPLKNSSRSMPAYKGCEKAGDLDHAGNSRLPPVDGDVAQFRVTVHLCDEIVCS